MTNQPNKCGPNAREFRRFARGVLQNYRALAGWVSRRGGISPTKALERRKKIDAKARALVDVARLAAELPALQQELNDLIEERRRADVFFRAGSVSAK